MRGRSTCRVRRSLPVATFLVIVAGGVVSARDETTPDPPDATDADVAVQGVVEFPAGTFHWRALESSLVAGDPPTPAPEPAALLLVGSGAVDVVGPFSVRLTAGEAAIFTGLPRASISTDDADGAGYWMLQIYNVENSGGPGATGDSFTVDQGPREVQLLRHALDAGEEVSIADHDVPVLVLATDGSVRVASSEGGEPAELAAGGSNTFDGDLAFTNAGDAPAAFVAAVVGPHLGDDAAETPAGGTTAPAQAPSATQPSTTPQPTVFTNLTVRIIELPAQVDASESRAFTVIAEVQAPPNGGQFEGELSVFIISGPCSFNEVNPSFTDLSPVVTFSIALEPLPSGATTAPTCTIQLQPSGQFVGGSQLVISIPVVP